MESVVAAPSSLLRSACARNMGSMLAVCSAVTPMPTCAQAVTQVVFKQALQHGRLVEEQQGTKDGLQQNTRLWSARLQQTEISSRKSWGPTLTSNAGSGPAAALLLDRQRPPIHSAITC
ncbi:hypothetical protein ACK3TF_000644 [Chlorella vulgaris]